MRIVLLGPPGSGKGELSGHIADSYGIPIITQSSVLDAAAAESTELGRLAKEARDASRVSDELLLALLRIQLPRMNLDDGYILVDMPKNSGQADVLDSLFADLRQPVDLVINLEVDPDDLMERLVGHIRCDHCGASYNMYVNPPMVDGVCDSCGARVCRRPDDYEETISNRLRVYETQMGPLLQYYSLNDKLQRVDAGCDPDRLWRTVKPIIDATPSQTVEDAQADEAVAAEPAAEPAKAKVEGKRAGRTRKKVVATRKVAASSGAKKTTDKPKVKSAANSTTKSAKSSATRKKAAKKAVAKQSVAKKTAARKSLAKKAAVKTAATKKPVSRKAAAKVGGAKVAKKKVAKKAAASRKVAAKKPVARKTNGKTVNRQAANTTAPARKSAAAKAAVKKAAARKTAARKTAVKKATGKVAARKAPNRKASAKKSVVRKSPAKKVVAKKPAIRKKVNRKAVAKKVAASRAARKVVTKKTAARKKVAKKATRKTSRR